MDSFLILTGKRNPSQKGLDSTGMSRFSLSHLSFLFVVVTTVWDMSYGTLHGTQALKFDEEEGKNVAQIAEGELLVSVR